MPLILIFATEFRRLKRSSASHYVLSGGTYPDQVRSVNLVSQFALPLELTPAQTMEIANKEVVKERRRQYNNSIIEITSTAVQSMVEQLPKRHFDLPRQWFNIEGCRQCVDVYLEPISRNINLKDHIPLAGNHRPLRDHNSPKHPIHIFPSIQH